MNAPNDQYTEVAVALIRADDGGVLLVWNAKWGSFTWPMTKVRQGEEPGAAAERAGAEALGVPVRAGEGKRLPGDLHVGDRDATIKLYVHHAYPVAAHPRFAAQAGPVGPHVWMSVGDIQSGEFRPLSDTCHVLIGRLAEAGLLPAGPG